jgi:hypothetical protein
MLLSEGAGAAGLIQRSSVARFLVVEIEQIAYRELMGLDKICGIEVKRNRRRRRLAHRGESSPPSELLPLCHRAFPSQLWNIFTQCVLEISN